jgi:hypothetical protein
MLVAAAKSPDVIGVVSVSPGEYNHKKVIGIHGEQFLTTDRVAEQAFERGNFNEIFRPGIPWDSM